MKLTNLSAEPTGKLHSWLPTDLEAEEVVFLPDACPGKSPLPTGTAVLTHQPDWRRFAVSDCGCGMRLLRSGLAPGELDQRRWDAVADRLRRNRGRLGDLGGGNHFLDALEPYDDGPLSFLVHTGSRNESGHVDDLVGSPDRFDAEFDRNVDWACDNRAAVHDALEAEFGPLELVLDLPHNTYERLADGGAVIRKGSVRVEPGDLTVLPSHMAGDVALVRATAAVAGTLDSMSHGTGRSMSRADCKPLAEQYDFAALRARGLLPTGLADASLRTDGPFAYRDLDDCLRLIDGYVETVARYAVVGYMGHL
ncbi:RNA-splicing ligase RtcB [Posidoniimonas polymericola]|uniref:3'-phosphate/5'-hydroxy nucleic acid ligase n=1 Tax=Posidoniimonas polymericola TaxID=2528002 RepID=A0A5C5ZEA3_9BACT|nr:RtcB family protein [Posidoniimonas polymericola]TWT85495.1 RNA-splicing ligase RtcB [Posidoniimonas polymericola]